MKTTMYLTGHVLLWHQQTPDWVFKDEQGNPATHELLLQRLESHIGEVVGHYKGRVQSWDVVNEALNDDGSLRETPWLQIIGEDYLQKAFEFAHKADPEALLFYNDYNLYKPEKRAGTVRLVSALLEKGVRIHGIGMQAHYGLYHPADMGEVEDSILAFSKLGVTVAITELDVRVLPFPEGNAEGADISINAEFDEKYNPYVDGLPEQIERAFNAQYLNLFTVLIRHQDKISRVTFWGLNDGVSWLNDWPIKGRTDYPLLFDRANRLKPVMQDIIALKKD